MTLFSFRCDHLPCVTNLLTVIEIHIAAMGTKLVQTSRKRRVFT